MAKNQIQTADALFSGGLDYASATTDWVELTSSGFFDYAGDAAGVLPGLPSGETFMLLLINATDAAGITYVKLGESNAGDGVANCLTVPAGTVFSIGLRGHKGRDGKGILTVSVKQTNSADAIKLVAQFDHTY